MLQWVGAVKGHLASLRDWTHKIDHDGHIVTLSWRGVMPLEGTAEQTYEVKLEVRLIVWADGVFAIVRCLRFAILRALLEIFVDTWEANHLEES